MDDFGVNGETQNKNDGMVRRVKMLKVLNDTYKNALRSMVFKPKDDALMIKRGCG